MSMTNESNRETYPHLTGKIGAHLIRGINDQIERNYALSSVSLPAMFARVEAYCAAKPLNNPERALEAFKGMDRLEQAAVMVIASYMETFDADPDINAFGTRIGKAVVKVVAIEVEQCQSNG